MTDSVGTYQVRNSGGTAIRIWPLVAGTTVAQVNAASTAVPVAPGLPNAVVVANHGVVDVALTLPTGAPVTRTAVTTTGLTAAVSGAGVTSATLFANADHCQLTFAVDVVGGTATPFVGSLRITIPATGGDCIVDIPLQVRANTNENGLYIPCTLVRQKTQYTWVRIKCVSQQGGAAVATGTGTIGALRDNSLVRDFNRLLPLRTVASGHVARPTGNVTGGQDRTIIGVPIALPITIDVRAPTFVRRVHMLRLEAAERTGHHNNNPHLPGDMQLHPVASASLATRTFFLDPGHGINYADPARRCYEWFLAHRIATRVSEILQTRHAVPVANITFTRTAGLSMVEPANVNAQNGPDTGAQRFTYDMTARTIHTAVAAPSLTDLSNLLLTTHTAVPPFPAEPVPNARRAEILTQNVATINAAIARTVAGLSGRTAVAASQRWDAATSRYVFDTRPTGAPTGPIQTHNIRINTTDVFAVSNDSLRRLAQRTARWSLNHEGLGTTAFQVATQAAMIAEGALTYMEDAIVREATRPAGDPFLAHGIEGWSFGRRRTVLSGLATAPNISLTFHHNALPTDGGTGRGMVMLASNAASATAPHLRLQKTFVKYVKGLEQGLREQGIVNTHGSALNGKPAALTNGYAFFETEFMNASSAVTGHSFAYEDLVLPAFINRTAEETVEALVEFLLNPQPNAEFDVAEVGKGITAGAAKW